MSQVAPPSIRAVDVSFDYAVSTPAVPAGFGADRRPATVTRIPALRDLAFEVDGGRTLLVVGPSGSGKSTLAKAIAGLIPSEVPGEWRGRIEVGGVDVSGPGPAASRSRVDASPSRADAPAWRPDVGIVFQDPGSQLVMEHAGDDVAFGLENRAWPRPAMRSRVPEVLAAVGLDGFAERRSDRLSGGEQQRLALAGVLAPRPGLLVLDEPTANLDPQGTAALYRILTGLRERRDVTIVLVEHRVELAWQLADSVVALGDDGSAIDVGPTKTVLRRSRARMDAAGIWLPTPSRGTSRGLNGVANGGVGAVPALEVREAWFSYEVGSPVLHGVSLEVDRGERVALVGANGSGKSTLLRLVLGLARPAAGFVRLGRHDPARLRSTDLARLAGYVVQDPELGFVGDTVREEVELGLSGSDVEAAAALAERLNLPLDEFGDRSPYRLSGGEQRRLSLVTALARRPALLVLDEPTFGQDRRGHEALVAILADLAASGTAILAATHDERFVAAFADRVVELDAGWLVEERAA